MTKKMKYSLQQNTSLRLISDDNHNFLKKEVKKENSLR